MDALSLIASLVKSLAWPLVVLIAVVLFRRAIAGRITSILKISHKDTAVEFDHAAREVEAAIVAEKLPVSARRIIEAKTHIPSNIGRIIFAWSEIEETMRGRLISAGIDVPTAGGRAIISLAREHNLITTEQLRALRGLQAMRNLAAHGRRDEIDESRTEEFLTLAEAIKTVLEITSHS